MLFRSPCHLFPPFVFYKADSLKICFRVSIVVSISACHADDPGSIPGRGVLTADIQTQLLAQVIVLFNILLP